MQNILIIGSSSGIGRELTRQLISSGTQVYGTYNKTTIPTVEENASFYSLDVLDDNLSLDFLPEALDGLVYCPGSVVLKPFSRIKPAEFVKDYELQVIGAVKIIQACLPRLKNSEQASIILFSTVAVQLGFNFHSLVSCSKGAIEGLVKALAAEFAPKIRVNCIAPSIMDTPLAAGLLNSPDKEKQMLNGIRLKGLDHLLMLLPLRSSCFPPKRVGSPDKSFM